MGRCYVRYVVLTEQIQTAVIVTASDYFDKQLVSAELLPTHTLSYVVKPEVDEG